MTEGTQKFILSTVGVLTMSILVGYLVFAWTEPSRNPPQGNVPAPINVGPQGQAKQGGLILNTDGASTGLIVQYGNVGIGTTNPTQKLDVAGYVKGTGLCIGSDCRTSWPAGGSPTTWDCTTVTGNWRAYCPSGYRLVSGGCMCGWRFMYRSYREDNSWVCWCRDISSNDIGGTAQAFCCR